jgi:hypothetical protein
MTIYVIVFLALVVYWKLKNQYGERVTLEFQYKLFDLRDTLREYAIAGKIDKDDMVFKYLDGSISKTVNDLETINLYSVFILTSRYRNNPEFLSHKERISKEIGANKYTQVFYEQYGELVGRYIIKKHFMIKFAFVLHILSHLISNHLITNMRQRLRRATDTVRFAPETSKAYEFC